MSQTPLLATRAIPSIPITATSIGYDNTTSGLTATDIKAAIDEIVAGGTSGLPWFVVTAYGAVGDGTTDDTTAINAAITAANAAGGGIVYVPGTTASFLATTIRLKTGVTLMGSGPGSIIKQKASTSGHLVILDSSSVTQTGVRDLFLDGNKASQSAANDGLHISGGTSYTPPNEVSFVTNVSVQNTKGDAMYFHNTGEWRVVGCYVAFSDGHGYDIDSFDMIFIGCSSGAAGLDGFHWTSGGTNSRAVGCKSYASGYVNYTTAGDGFHVEAARAHISGCEAQDNYRHGLYVGAVANGMFVANDFDSNGFVLGDGIWLNNTTDSTFTGNVYTRTTAGNLTRHAISIGSSSSGNRINLIYAGLSGTPVDGTGSNNDIWVGTGVVELTAHKNAASGYAGLDSSTLLATAQMGTGSASSSTYLRGDRTWQTVAGATALDDLSDVTITTPVSGNRLRYSGSVWVNSPLRWEPHISYDGTVLFDGAGDPVMVEVSD